MNGNIIGEQFDELLLFEIDKRQSIHGSGLNSKRTPAQIQYLNKDLYIFLKEYKN